MTLLVKAVGLMKEWNGRTLFENAGIEIYEGDRVALFGRNGTGKSTFFRLLTGDLQPDQGSVERRLPAAEWGWMRQQAEVDPQTETLEYVQAYSNPDLHTLKTGIRELEARMAEEEPAGAKGGESAYEAYGELMERYARLGGYDWEVEAEKRLQQLKMGPECWRIPFLRLSGGQKTRAQLAALMVSSPKLLLLDEPTNHLDSESLEWLEQWMRAYPGTILFVSHDREFLDRTATSLYELTEKGTVRYSGGYSAYKTQKELEMRTQEGLYKKQQRARRELEECIRNYKQWFQQAHRAATKVEVGVTKSFYLAKANKNRSRFKAKERELERLEAEQVDKPRGGPRLNMELAGEDFAARTLLRAENLRLAFGEMPLFEGLNVTMERGDRLAVLGPNGAGKSTLLKLLLGRIEPDSGEVVHHPRLRTGYFSQELEGLAGEETLLDTLLALPSMTETAARTILGCFLFPADAAFKKLSDLSMGERCRAAFLRLYFSGANLLVLDEPTNYLDIDTREQIEAALERFPGALAVVSHDRYLIRRTANRLLMLHPPDGAPEFFRGTYAEYADRDQSDASAPPSPRSDEIRRLELRLARLIAGPEEGGPEGAPDRMGAIRSLRDRIESLRTGGEESPYPDSGTDPEG
ncbi:ribosomal protection-like ABC-F family protein [Paenibacillus chitinolyticus]|uniref:ribosomal protection-like ABC-F family protein n=1 Tax=Paenibacillus chitinolyticus TaxID=79263 RepID=UPI0035DA281B